MTVLETGLMWVTEFPGLGWLCPLLALTLAARSLVHLGTFSGLEHFPCSPVLSFCHLCWSFLFSGGLGCWVSLDKNFMQDRCTVVSLAGMKTVTLSVAISRAGLVTEYRTLYSSHVHEYFT